MYYPSFTVSSLGDSGGSAYYRVLLPLLFCDAAGHIQLRMPNQFHFYPVEYLKTIKPDTIVFHRSHTDPQRKYINELSHEIDLLKVYTIDDWVGKVPKESPHYKAVSPTADKEIKKAIGLCDRLIVTNDYLANVYGYKKDTTVIPNYLPSTSWVGLYATNPRKPNLETNRPIRIGWSGGMGHPGDLKILREIADILGEKVRWVFLGDIPTGFDQGNSEVHQPVSPTEYSKQLYSLNLDLALAPLLDNEFNRAKSNLRILEYGACGYPVIASNVLPYKDAPITLLEYNAKWWVNEIQKKIADLEALSKEGEELKNWVWKNYKLEDHLEEYADILSPDGKGFRPSKPEVEDTVDVIVTTYNQLEQVKNCVDSILESLPLNKTKVEVIVADDASTEANMKEYLDSIALKDSVKVLIADKNIGYVNNINRGLKVHDNRDVISINSDTLVNGNWIDRLKNTAYSNERIASVTPFTNNLIIFSYPNPETSETNMDLVKSYDNLCSSLKLEEYLPVPTSGGFCNYLKRQTLADVGLFDPHAFGRGYGEENEWSMRSQKRMWHHVLGHNCYVGHLGGTSFGKDKQKLLENAAKVLVSRWQQYPQIIKQYIQNNPIGGVRQRLDILSITKAGGQNRILYIAHSLGGGLETYLQTQLKENKGSIILRCDPEKVGMARLEFEGEKYFNIPPLNIRLSSIEFLKQFFEGAGVKRISIQTTFGYDYNFPIWIKNLAKAMNIPYEVMLHDYWMMCPRLRMVQGTDYCGDPDSDTCNKCVITYGSGLGQVDVKDWRKMHEEFLEEAEKVVAPSKDLSNRIKGHYPNLSIEVIPHETNLKIGEFKGFKEWDGKEELRVAVIGGISPDKGSLLIRDCAKYCLDNKIPVKFVVFGSLVDDSLVLKMIPPSQTLTILGNYEEQDITTLLTLNACHIGFNSSLCPETYSYTLSHMFRAGLWPVCFDIGAPPERIREFNFGTVLPYELRTDPVKVVDAILEVAKGRVV